MSTQLLFIHARSPLHAGTGQGVGAIDLPIAREKATGIPYLPGSSIKGPLRDQSDPNDAKTAVVFGPNTNAASDHAGAAVFSDARLLLLPVRSLAGTFAWVTSPYLLERFVQDAEYSGLKPVGKTWEIPKPSLTKEEAQAFVVAETHALAVNVKVVLEDLDLTLVQDPLTGEWATRLEPLVFDPSRAGQLSKRLCVVHDDVLGFLLDTATEVVARVKINDDTKTVQKGGLWYEESLPTESVLVGLVSASKGRSSTNAMEAQAVSSFVYDLAHNKSIQLGGKATVGRGLCRLRFALAAPKVVPE